jgi:ABC-type transport system involved in multi-copper enzyme maturation permease subunit
MNLLGKLFSIEWTKVRKRSAFWIAIVVQVAVLSIALSVQQYAHHVKPQNHPFQLPAGWEMLISTGAQIGMLMLFISIALLTASEATWRTQRQNVIDGLSRGQFFGAKILVAVILAFLLWLSIPIVGLVIAPFGGPGSIGSPVLSPVAQRMLPNALLYLVAIATTALMFSMIAPSSGAALGLLFAFIIIEPIAGSIMVMQGGLWPAIARFLPLSVFNNLTSRIMYDPAMAARMAQASEKAGRPGPLTLETSVITTIIYIAVFIAITWLAFRKRDL